MPKRVYMNECNLIPLRLIRIAHNYSVKDIAESFIVTPAFINAIEKGDKSMSRRNLYFGLKEIGITLESYDELSKFVNNIINSDLSSDQKYSLSLMKTILLTTPNVEEVKINKELVKKLDKYSK